MVAPNKETVAVFLLDDDSSVLKATSRLLDSVGWKVEAFTNPIEFLERAATYSPELAVIDILMPEMNGLEVQTRLRRISPPVPRVIMLTARDDPSVRRMAMNAGASASSSSKAWKAANFSPESSLRQIPGISWSVRRQRPATKPYGLKSHRRYGSTADVCPGYKQLKQNNYLRLTSLFLAIKLIVMKKLLFSTAVLTALLAAPLQAGTETYKQVAPPPPPPMYGLGFYGAIDMGANVYQNRGGSRILRSIIRIREFLDLISM